MRTSEQKINATLKRQINQIFVQTLTDLRSLQETDEFLQDFFNESELESFAKRLAIAYWLKKGRSYSNIKENLKVSSATIATVQQLMDKPGFLLALKKIEAEEWSNVWSEKIRKFVGKK